MPDIPDEALHEWHEDRQRRRYAAHLAQHPHPADPDHPDPAEYGLEEDEDE